MILLGLAYFVAVAGGIAVILWRNASQYGGGNHWVYFGTMLDQWIQSLGFWLVPILTAPLLAFAMICLSQGAVRAGLGQAVMALILALLTARFVLVALD